MMYTPDYSQGLIEQWLQSVVSTASELHPPVTSIPSLSSRKRKRGDTSDDIVDAPPQTQALMSTPPSSHSSPGRWSPKKRKILATRSRDDGKDDSSSDPFTDTDATPRRSTTTPTGSFFGVVDNMPQLAAAPRTSGARSAVSSSAPSDSGTTNTTTTTSRSARSRAGARGTSPTKKTQSLLALRKPIRFTTIDDGRELPADVADLYSRLLAITDDHQGIFPAAAREEIGKAAGRKFGDLWFQQTVEQAVTAATTTTTTTTTTIATPEQREGEAAAVKRRARELALAELALLQKLKRAATRCRELARSEAAWNLEVHGPLLEHALDAEKNNCGRRRQHVSRELVTSAQIARPFVPPMADHVSAEFAEKKMVDFVLVLDAAGTKDTADKEEEEEEEEESKYRRLARDINRVVQSQPKDCATVNQTAYTPLWFRPVAVSIETKVAGGDAEEGRAQLAVWAAAWHERMKTFLSAGVGEDERLITLPLLLITEHIWVLSFACDRGRNLEVVGDVTLGDTQSLKGIYQLVAAVRELGRWIEGPFLDWMGWVLSEVK